MTWIKICGITNEADALLAVGLGADAVGIIFAPSPRQVSLSVAGDIVRRMPPETPVVGVFRDEAPARIIEITNQVGLRAVQLHGNESRADVHYLSERIPLVIKAFAATSPMIPHFAEYGADLLLIDGPNPGSGQVFDWRLAEGVGDADRLVLSGGLHAENVQSAIEQLHPYGVDVASGVESSPGVKDPRRLRAFIDGVRQVENEHKRSHGSDDGPFDWSTR